MTTKTTGPQNLNVTYLVPFAGNRMNQRTGGPVHILKREDLTGSRTWCDLTVKTGRTTYSQRSRLTKDQHANLHDACFRAYLSR